jgi:hypothetical protein
MSKTRIDIIVLAGCLAAWVGIFVASWHGKLGVSGKISDSLLAFLALMIVHRLWRIYRRRG